jgi:hypothetical protein
VACGELSSWDGPAVLPCFSVPATWMHDNLSAHGAPAQTEQDVASLWRRSIISIIALAPGGNPESPSDGTCTTLPSTGVSSDAGSRRNGESGQLNREPELGTRDKWGQGSESSHKHGSTNSASAWGWLGEPRRWGRAVVIGAVGAVGAVGVGIGVHMCIYTISTPR